MGVKDSKPQSPDCIPHNSKYTTRKNRRKSCAFHSITGRHLHYPYTYTASSWRERRRLLHRKREEENDSDDDGDGDELMKITMETMMKRGGDRGLYT
eukprot:817737-Ditylum_brightwellii.AAC.1